MLPWLRRHLNGRWQTAIAARPDTLCLRFPDAPPLRVVHGAPGDPWKGIRPDNRDEAVQALRAGVEEGTLVAGHTHLPMDRTAGRRRALNPGSVGVPIDERLAASYALLEASGDEGAAHLGMTDSHRRRRAPNGPAGRPVVCGVLCQFLRRGENQAVLP